MAGALVGSLPLVILYAFFVEHYVSAMTGAGRNRWAGRRFLARRITADAGRRYRNRIRPAIVKQARRKLRA
jgi:hypothetical protein